MFDETRHVEIFFIKEEVFWEKKSHSRVKPMHKYSITSSHCQKTVMVEHPIVFLIIT